MRVGVWVSLFSLLVLATSGCANNQWTRIAMPEPRTTEADHMLTLWRYAWVAAIAVGVVVWGLIFYAVIHFRRRSDDEVPRQIRYNLPIEIFYTIAPVMMVIVFFHATLNTQNQVTPTHQPQAQRTIKVVGQKWSWTFNYVDDSAIGGKTVWESGTPAHFPTLYLPVDEKIHFELYSADVIHSFWVPAFLFKMDVVPGRNNNFTLTPDKIGVYEGKCAELCGEYHSRMLFNVHVVSEADYEAHLKKLEAEGNTGMALGGSLIDKNAGLNANHDGGN